MAHAIYAGAVGAGALDPGLVGALDPNAERRALFGHGFDEPGTALRWAAGASGGEAPVLVLAVKPQMLGEAIEPLLGPLRESRAEPLVISVLAGTRIERISRAMQAGLGSGGGRVIRVMPNTPAQVRRGMSAIALGPSATGEDHELAEALFSSVGEVLTIEEAQMDGFTALAGSGPAYLFYLAQGMLAGARAVGFDEAQAGMIVRQTLLGSASLLSASDDTPGDLRARVTSKNGTTHAATTTLDERGVMVAIEAAVVAARDRGQELGRA